MHGHKPMDTTMSAFIIITFSTFINHGHTSDNQSHKLDVQIIFIDHIDIHIDFPLNRTWSSDL